MTISKSRSSKCDAQAWAMITARDWRHWLYGRCALNMLWAPVVHLRAYCLQVRNQTPTASRPTPLHLTPFFSGSYGSTRTRLPEAMRVDAGWEGYRDFSRGSWGEKIREWIWRLEREEGKPVAGRWGVDQVARIWQDWKWVVLWQAEWVRASSPGLKQWSGRGCVPFMFCGQESGAPWILVRARDEWGLSFYFMPDSQTWFCMFPKICWTFPHAHSMATSLLHPSGIHVPFLTLPVLNGPTIHLIPQGRHVSLPCHLPSLATSVFPPQ